ncbi:MAG: hypothetical protein ACFCVD_00175 [Nodosilinea sp.]
MLSYIAGFVELMGRVAGADEEALGGLAALFVEGGLFGVCGDDGEGAENVGELGFGEAVEVGDDAI